MGERVGSWSPRREAVRCAGLGSRLTRGCGVHKSRHNTPYTSTGDRASERVNVVVLSRRAPRPERACVNLGARGVGVRSFSRARAARGSGALGDHPSSRRHSSHHLLGRGAHTCRPRPPQASPPHVAAATRSRFAPATCARGGAERACRFAHGTYTEWRALERRASTLAGRMFDRSLACQAGEIIEQDTGHLNSSTLLFARARVDDRARSNPSKTAQRQCERRS